MLKIGIISIIINMTARTCRWWGFCDPCFVDIGIGLGGGLSIKLLGIAHFEGKGGGDGGGAQIVLYLFMKRKTMPRNLYIAKKQGLGRQILKIRHVLVLVLDIF